MPYSHWGGLLQGSVSLTTEEEHKLLRRETQNINKRLKGFEDDLELKAGIDEVRKLRGELKSTVRKSELSCELKILKNFENELEKLSNGIKEFKKIVNSTEFEKEIGEVFARQFARFDDACKKCTKVHKQFEKEVDGTWKKINEEKERIYNDLEGWIQKGVNECIGNSFDELKQSFSKKIEEVQKNVCGVQSAQKGFEKIQQQQLEGVKDCDKFLKKLQKEQELNRENVNNVIENIEESRQFFLKEIGKINDWIQHFQVEKSLAENYYQQQGNAIQLLQHFNQEMGLQSWKGFWKRLRWIFNGNIPVNEA